MKKINNKGFTLIEIIGIIVILAVIMIVTVPILENTLRNSKDNNYKKFFKNIDLITENYIVDNRLTTESQVCVSLETLLEKKYIDEIPSLPQPDPLKAGEILNSTDTICGVKNSEQIYEYELCRGGVCSFIDDFISQEKSYFDLTSFKEIKTTTLTDVKNIYFIKGIDTTNAIDGTVIDLSEDEDESIKGWKISNEDDTYDYYIGSKNLIYCRNLKEAFAGLQNLETISFGNFVTTEVTDMSYMFYDLRSLIRVNVDNFDTSNVTDMSYMFSIEPGYINENLIDLNVGNFKTSNVTNMSYMFNGLGGLTSLNLENFNTSKVINMESMFYDMYSLITLDVSNFNTSKVTSMTDMFGGMDSLISLNLSNFDTTNVVDVLYTGDGYTYGGMDYMFWDMDNLQKLDISGFSKITLESDDIAGTFNGFICNPIGTVYVNETIKDSVIETLTGCNVEIEVK